MIARRETPLALYKGLGAVLSGIVPKMAVRFASFEAYKGWLADKETGQTSMGNVFLGTSSSLCVLRLHAHVYAHSWPRCGHERGRRRRYADGSREDPSASTTALARRPTRDTAIPERGARSLHDRPRRRHRHTLPRCLAHCASPGDEPGCQLHGVPGAQEGCAQVAT